MSDSIALGFWAKHCAAMDAFYEEEELNEELRKIQADEANGELLGSVMAAAEEDVRAFLAQVQLQLDAELGRRGSPFKVLKKHAGDEWSLRIDLELRNGRLPRGPLQLGVEIRTIRGDRLCCFVWLWSKGGRSAERAFANNLVDVIEGAHDRRVSWNSGCCLLLGEDLSSPELRGDSEFSVDLGKLLQKLRDRLCAQTNDRLKSLVSALRGE